MGVDARLRPMTPSDLAAAPGGPSGPPADHWINRFARFADEVPDLRRDGETPPQAVADATKLVFRIDQPSARARGEAR